MIIISYNCRGFNDIKARYIRKLTEDCHIIFCVEHWILQNKLHILNKCAPNFNIFATSGMIENKLILGRRYGGCSVFINKSIKCTSRLLDCDCRRLCAVLSTFQDYKVLFIAVYMPTDLSCNIAEFNFVLSSIQALQNLYLPDFVIYGGDWNTDFSRLQSLHTRSLSTFCQDDGLVNVIAIERPIEFTYISDMNGAKSLIDHFIISSQILECVTNVCVMNDVENQSDHLPISLSINLPIEKVQIINERNFISKPKWFVADFAMLQCYKNELDKALKQIILPLHIIECDTKLCTIHECHIQLFHDQIIHALLVACQRVIPFTKPFAPNVKSGRPGWNEHVADDFNHALHSWHSIYLAHGCPTSGFIF